MGLIPHQIRGFAATFQNILISGQSYDCCSACSPRIIDEFKNSGWEFVKKALLDESYVSDLSGLTEVQRLAEQASAEVDWSESDDIDGFYEEEFL